jgi:hypothetical protein
MKKLILSLAILLALSVSYVMADYVEGDTCGRQLKSPPDCTTVGQVCYNYTCSGWYWCWWQGPYHCKNVNGEGGVDVGCSCQ